MSRRTDRVSKDTIEWAAKEIADGALESSLARNEDGSPKTLRQLLDEARPKPKALP